MSKMSNAWQNAEGECPKGGNSECIDCNYMLDEGLWRDCPVLVETNDKMKRTDIWKPIYILIFLFFTFVSLTTWILYAYTGIEMLAIVDIVSIIALCIWSFKMNPIIIN